MAILRYRAQRGNQSPAKNDHRAPSWPGRPVADSDGISFDDILALPEPDWATRTRRPAPSRPRPADPYAWQAGAAAVVHAIVVAYDDIADEVQAALSELAALAPLTAKQVAP